MEKKPPDRWHPPARAQNGTDSVGRRNESRWCRRQGTGLTTAQMLANLTVAELFHTPDGAAFADLMIDAHRETWPVRSTRFRSWLRRKYYEATGAVPGAGA